jgi:hypothetical protein
MRHRHKCVLDNLIRLNEWLAKCFVCGEIYEFKIKKHRCDFSNCESLAYSDGYSVERCRDCGRYWGVDETGVALLTPELAKRQIEILKGGVVDEG